MKTVEIENLWFKYTSSKDWILKSINLSIEAGEFVAITGATGAGKSTLCFTLNGIIPHNLTGDFRGIVKVLGVDTLSTKVSDLAKQIGMTFQDPESQLFGLTVEEEVAFGLENFGIAPDEMEKRITWALDVVRMLDLREKSPYELSGGQKQRVAIASSLALHPKILVMDEPTSELDPIGKSEVFSVIERLQDEFDMSIVLIEHETEEIAKFADRMILMRDGTIAIDAPPAEYFDQLPILESCGIKIPQIIEFAHVLRARGLWPDSIPTVFSDALNQSRAIFSSVPRSNFSFLEKVSSSSSDIRNDTSQDNTNDALIEVRNLVHRYPDGTLALNGINLTIRRGEYVGIIGQNGSGKTTLAKHLNGLLKPTTGTVMVDGINTTKCTVAELSRKVGYAFQNPDHQIFLDTVENEILYGPRNLGFSEDRMRDVLDNSLRLLKLEHLKTEHPLFMSRGERKAISVASVLAMDPEVVILDEPTTGQDWKNSLNILDVLDELNRRGKTVILVTHDMRLVAENTKRTIVMRQGRVLLDLPTRAAFSKPEILETSFIKPPQITQLAQNLFSATVLSTQELCDRLMQSNKVVFNQKN
ncbi:MAG: energy-coupling factor transporter ATPase [archaeon]|nr:energy-coupling factor transporter ATPase [archaeon]